MSNTKESVVLKYDDMGIPSIMLKVENTASTSQKRLDMKILHPIRKNCSPPIA